MVQIFISYRRADTIEESRLIYDALAARFGENHVFRDQNRIPKGMDFRTAIEKYVFSSDEILVLIGQKWLDIREDDNPDLRRLDNPQDYVRIEVEMGLRHAKNVTPVVLQGAVMPTETELPLRLVQLSYQNAYFLRPEYFENDLQALVDDIARRHEVPAPKAKTTLPVRSMLIMIAALAVFVAGALFLNNRGRNQETALLIPASTATFASTTQAPPTLANTTQASPALASTTQAPSTLGIPDTPAGLSQTYRSLNHPIVFDYPAGWVSGFNKGQPIFASSQNALGQFLDRQTMPRGDLVLTFINETGKTDVTGELEDAAKQVRTSSALMGEVETLTDGAAVTVSALPGGVRARLVAIQRESSVLIFVIYALSSDSSEQDSLIAQIASSARLE